MAWITPIIDRGEGSFCLPSDLNRIGNNINFLLGTNLKTDFVPNDFLTADQWQSIIDKTIEACNTYGIMIIQNPTTDMTSDNFNNVENLLLLCYNALTLWQRQANTNIYVQNQYGRYVGVPSNNYVRGFNS